MNRMEKDVETFNVIQSLCQKPVMDSEF